MTRHHLFDPESLPAAVGFSYGAVAAPGRPLHIAGIIGMDEGGNLAPDLPGQFGDACAGVAKVITAAGGDPTDLVSMTIYCTDLDAYRTSTKEIGARYREVFGRHFPPMALIGVSELFEKDALVELVCVAVVPDDAQSSSTKTGSS